MVATAGADRVAKAPSPRPLQLEDVLDSVTGRYPPLLAALIERDIAAGRLQSAEGVFDLQAFARLFSNPTGYYESTTVEAGFEQFLGFGGATVFGGYRLTEGDLLPLYDKLRTQGGGAPRLGVRIPLLRDGAIDRRRATVRKAEIDRSLVDPLIHRQQLDFRRAATVAYFQWLAAGVRLQVSEELRRLARDRVGALFDQATAGLIPRIVLTDNRRLIVARDIAVVQARRRLEAAGLALSLFLRDEADEPQLADRTRLPGEFPRIDPPDLGRVEEDVEQGLAVRPELRRVRLAREKVEVDRTLARNQMLPNLDAGVNASQGLGERRYKDQSQFELEVGVELRVPLQRREAKGRLAEAEARLGQLLQEERFARDRIVAEVRDGFSALQAAWEQIQQARQNVELALELQSAEEERFRRGATDLLALQIREQATFDAQITAIEAHADYFRAAADYRAATSLDVRPGSEELPDRKDPPRARAGSTE